MTTGGVSPSTGNNGGAVPWPSTGLRPDSGVHGGCELDGGVEVGRSDEWPGACLAEVGSELAREAGGWPALARLFSSSQLSEA